MFYIVYPDRNQKRGIDRYPSDTWYNATDLPSPRWWRLEISGKDTPVDDRDVLPGETIELVQIISSESEYYGIRTSKEIAHVLRRVRLEADDTYTELYQSERYKKHIASGTLRMALWERKI